MKPGETRRYRVEVTDTFGGEANYSWVRRHTIVVPDDAKTPAIVRAAKAAQGWTGQRCDTAMIGETIEVTPRGACMVMFIDAILDDLPGKQDDGESLILSGE